MLYGKVIKRVLDILISLIALPFVLLLGIPIAIAVKAEDGGSIFYLSERYGKDMKKFRMLKFRSMKMNARDIRNADGSTYNSESDDRQTRVGKFLRKTSLDELPQFLNVLVGQMALIGPRPVLESQLESFTEEEKGKLDVLPGITGYTQAYHRNQLPTHEERMQDAWYAQHVSFGLDVKIFFKTIDTVIHPSRVYRN